MISEQLMEEMRTGKVFSATFIKKDGSLRTMNCRLGVRSHLKGGELRYDPLERGLLPVFDMQKQDYRMINLKTLRNLKIGGQEHVFES